MTSTEELIELSKRVAEKLEIDAFEYISDNAGYMRWLYEDSAKCGELEWEHQLNLYHYTDGVMAQNKEGGQYFEHDSAHENWRGQASRVAILRALEGM
jgi:hypothetical protein